MDLFFEEKQEFVLPDAHLEYFPNCFTESESNRYFNILKSDTVWREDDIKVFGKVYKQPRLTALFGENNKSYSYSNITMYPTPFTSSILDIKSKVCLLYTSPSPRDGATSRMPSSA